MNPLVSLIIPVYNKENYLGQCIASVADQSVYEIEILVIDDNSTDNSAKIAKKYASTDPRIHVITNSRNLGLYRSRQLGVLKSHAPYIQFVDADDWLEPYATQQLLESIERHNTDLAQMRTVRVAGKVKTKYSTFYNYDLENCRVDGEDFRSLASFIGMQSVITPSCWDKLYRHNILKDCFQIDYADFWGEDQVINMQYVRQARSIAMTSYVGYNYRWGGGTSRYTFNVLQSYKNVWHLKKLMGMDSKLINDELQSLLRYHIRQLLTELSWTSAMTIRELEAELNSSIWKEIGIDITAEELVAEELGNIKQKPWKYLIKKLLK